MIKYSRACGCECELSTKEKTVPLSYGTEKKSSPSSQRNALNMWINVSFHATTTTTTKIVWISFFDNKCEWIVVPLFGDALISNIVHICIYGDEKEKKLYFIYFRCEDKQNRIHTTEVKKNTTLFTHMTTSIWKFNR